MRVEGVLMDVGRFVHPRHPASSVKPRVPPKPNGKMSDRKKAEKNSVLSNQ